jgi:hypothetical protein
MTELMQSLKGDLCLPHAWRGTVRWLREREVDRAENVVPLICGS